MSNVTVDTITWDYDLKKILLKDKYENDNPIKNILKVKNFKTHVEDYSVVQDVFEILTGRSTKYRDIMNSFWTTYKFMLQIEYPEIFRPLGDLKDDMSLKISNNDTVLGLHQGYPPLISKIDIKYIKYYEKNFNYSLPKFSNSEDIKETWIDFLFKNFDKFEKVHENVELKRFAQLTHTIGNITVVPLGFNAGRYNSTSDYWDISLKYLREFLEPLDGWTSYVKMYSMEPFLKKDNTPAELWQNHLENEAPLFPEDAPAIAEFLFRVNKSIESRGKILISRLHEVPKYSDELWKK